MMRPLRPVPLAALALALALSSPGTAQLSREGGRNDAFSAASVEPEEVVTRGWGHPEFGRLVFDWAGAVTYRAQIFAGQLRISFDRPLRTSLDEAQRNLAGYLTDLRIVNGRVVTGELKGSYRVRSFANDNAVVVDLVPGSETADALDGVSEQESWKDRMPVVPVRAGKHPGFGRIVFDWDGDVGYELERDGDTVLMRFDRPARIDVSGLSASLPGRVSDATADLRRTDVRVALVIPEYARIRHFRDRMGVAVDILAPDPEASADRPLEMTDGDPSAPVRPSTKVNATGESGEAKQHAQEDDATGEKGPKPVSLTRTHDEKSVQPEPAPGRFVGAPLVTVESTRRGAAFDVRFNWRKPVNAAVYRRDDYLWMIFGDSARFPLRGVEIAGEGVVDDARQTEAGDRSVVRFTVSDRLKATVTTSGHVWNLRLAPERMTGPVETPVQLRPVTGPSGESGIEVLASGLERPHRIVDPEIGDVLFVYPVLKPGIGNRVVRRLVDFEVPASALGLVVAPRRDDLRLTRTADGISVTRPGGLALSRATDTAGREIVREVDHSLAGISTWRHGSASDFEDNRLVMIENVLAAGDGARNEARLDLARFLLAHGLSADALGVSEIVVREEPGLRDRPEVRALQGAAHFLLGHYANAADAFRHDQLKDDPSVAPWKAGIAAARGDWVQAHHLMRESAAEVGAMPPKLRARFTLIGAEAALAVKDTDSAKPWLDALAALPLDTEQALYRQYLIGHRVLLDGKPNAAMNAWRGIANSESRLLRAKARFSLINTQLENGNIKRDEAIRKLEELSFAWRGDAFEFDVKRRLGELYAASEDYRTSLLRLRQAASNFKEVDGAEAIAHDMRTRFRKLFLDGDANGMAPVRALALYEEFRELTPPGRDGDEMIRQLADRLVKVDLLSEAGRLLDHQVRFRLTGRERSRVGARLALIRLLDRKPAKAIEALERSESDEISDGLLNQRRHLKVRALTELGRGNDAIALLAGDVSHDAEMLRLGVYWQEENWVEVARTIRRLIPETDIDTLTDEKGELVLRWAIALTLRNDIDGLLLLRDRFSAAIAGTGSAEAFRAIAGIEIGKVPDFRTLVKRMGDLGNFESFMASYREKVRKGEVSAIN